MAGRKYVSDYTLENHVSPDGSIQQQSVYKGTYYQFCRSREEIRRLQHILYAGCAVVFLLMLPLLFDNTRLSRTIYCILPAAFALIPLYLLMTAARRIGKCEEAFTREDRDKTDQRIRVCTVWLAALLAADLLGIILHWCFSGFALGELLPSVCLVLALAISGLLLTQRKKAAAREVPSAEE